MRVGAEIVDADHRPVEGPAWPGISHDSARAEAQATFVGVITTPLVTAGTDPVLFGRVLRHRARIGEWLGKLGYRLVLTGTVARLHRDPAGPQATAAPPPWDAPARRDLVLLALAAAACEETDTTTTVQELSDEVRVLSVAPDARITPYDPDRRAERQTFVRALGRLVDLGILIRRTSDEALLRQWEEDGTGVGAGYEADRDALLQFTDPYTVELAFDSPGQAGEDDGEDTARIATRGQRMLRMLVEDTALVFADLHPLDADYARSQRSWLAGQCAEMTGGTVEMRAEGMLLRLPDDAEYSARAIPVFPAANAPSWFALKILEAALWAAAPDENGQVHLRNEQVDAIAVRAYADHRRALTKALADSPDRLRAAAEHILGGLGLIRVSDAGWTVLPVAGRYREARAVWEPARIDMEPDAEEASV